MHAGWKKEECPRKPTRRYHEEKAKGGIALTMFGGSSNVDRDFANIFRQLNVATDEIIPHFQQFQRTNARPGRRADVPDHPSRAARGSACR